MTQKVLFLQGLPGSGKSTYAKELVDKGPRWKRVNKDDLRAMIDNKKRSKQNENNILKARDALILSFIQSGHDVIVDDTNLVGTHISHIKSLIRGTGYTEVEFETKFMDTPLSVCIARDLARDPEHSVGRRVIRNMYEQIKDLYIQKYEPNPDLPWCLIVDIDGTLAHMSGRSPYDYTKVSTDTVDETVRDMVNKYRGNGLLQDNYIVIVSGRDDTCKEDTLNWLNDNGIYFDELHMRDTEAVDKNGNKLDDTVIKKDIYNKWIKNRYNVRFVLDDRNRVVDMWRSLGLKVLQVGEGDF